MISVEISPGEAYDRMCILIIKRNKIKDHDKLCIINQQYHMLEKEITDYINNDVDFSDLCMSDVSELLAELIRVNTIIWNVEDIVRECESKGDFGQEFVKAARTVYHTNDARHRAKKEIDRLFKSELSEQKEHTIYEKDITIG